MLIFSCLFCNKLSSTEHISNLCTEVNIHNKTHDTKAWLQTKVVKTTAYLWLTKRLTDEGKNLFGVIASMRFRAGFGVILINLIRSVCQHDGDLSGITVIYYPFLYAFVEKVFTIHIVDLQGWYAWKSQGKIFS